MSQQNSLFSPDEEPLLVNNDHFVSTSISESIPGIGQWEVNPRLAEEITETTPLVQNVLPMGGFSVAQTVATDTEGFDILHSNPEPMTLTGQRYLAAEEIERLHTDSEMIEQPSTESIQAVTEIIQSVTESIQPVTESIQPVTEIIQPVTELIVLQHNGPGPSGDTDCSTTCLSDGYTKQVKIFSDVTAVLSTEVLSVIPGSQSVLFQTIQSDYGVHLSLVTQQEQNIPQIHISGDLSALTKVERKLESVCGITKPTNGTEELNNDNNVNKDNMFASCPQHQKPKTVDKSISCDLLQPTISQRGRVIKPLSRYNSYVQLNSLLESDEIDENPRQKRKRKAQPRKLYPSQNQTVSEDSVEPESSSVPHLEQPADGNILVQEEGQADNTPAQGDTSGQITKCAENDGCSDKSMEESELASDTTRDKKVKTKKDYERLAPFKFFCKKCSFRTKRLSHFNNHKRLHEKQMELHRCQKCSFSSLRLSHLNRHEATHSIQMFTCDMCTYSTHQFKLLDRHKRAKHNPEKDYTKSTVLLSCPSCDYTTERQFHFQRHMRTHPEFVDDTDEKKSADGKSFSCDLCPYVTQRKECLYRHKGNKHSDKRPYLCDLCGKSFKRPDALVQHKVTHVDKTLRNYQFKCDRCHKVFRSQAHLTDHLGSHSSQRSHLCYICGTAFKTRSVQRKHMQTIHLNPGAFQCQHCQKRFNTKFALNRHERTHLSEHSSDRVSNIINTADVSDTGITTEDQHIQVHQVHDVIVPSVGEIYEPTGEAIQQALIQTDKGPATVYYLSGFPAFQDVN